MESEAGSEAPRLLLGLALQQAREAAKITVKSVAAAVGVSTQTIWRMESGLVSSRLTAVVAMTDLYQCDPQVREHMISLAKETRSKGWWHAYGEVVPVWFGQYVGLEQSASRLQIFAPSLVPGLLQHRDYMRYVIQVDRPDLSKDDVESRVDLKLSRQKLLTRPLPEPPYLDVILNEAVLMADIGNDVMSQQIRTLQAASLTPNITIRVLPVRNGLHRASVSGAFTMLHFAERSAATPPGTVYFESLTGALYLTKPNEFAAYNEVWQSISSVSLDVAQTADLFTEMLKELNDRER